MTPVAGAPVQPTLWDARDEAEQRKQEGMARAWDNAGEWREPALDTLADFLHTLPDGAEVTADDWRPFVARSVGEPPHPRVDWGPLTATAARREWISWTGRFATSRQPRGHANPIRVWRVNRRNVP